MSIELETYEKIRYYREQGAYGKKEVARMLGISKNTVKKYWDGSTVPWDRKEGSGRSVSVLNEEIMDFIQNCLKEDETAPRKQRHTARRIYERLVSEKNFTGAESTIRNIVADLKKRNPKAFVPLTFLPGESIQVDWGEATIFLNGIKTKINIWCMRECYSCAIYVEAFYRQNIESFLEGMKNGFEYFGGVPKKVIFDNAKVAVSEGFGKTAKTTENYRKMSAHYVFTPTFCNVAEGHEKGLVENLVGYCRRNTLVPIPHVESLDELNTQLLSFCNKYHNHKINGKAASVGTMLWESENALKQLPPYPYDTSRTESAKVSSFAMVKFDYNKYSVPFHYSGKDVTVKAYGRKIEIISSHNIIANYERDYHRNNVHYQLEHYIELIERRPRSVYNAAPVRNTVPEKLYDYLLKLNSPEDVIKTLRLYMNDKEAVMNALEHSYSDKQFISFIEEKAKLSCSPKIITVKVNTPQLSKYDELIRSC